jgi:hypothetical protein
VPIEEASPIEIASLWRLGFLEADDVGRVCMRWLEQDQDGGHAEIAALAGRTGLAVSDIAPAFEGALAHLAGRPMDRDEAILRALRLYLSAALENDLMEGVGRVVRHFHGLSERRLVIHPRRRQDRPTEAFAEQNLGLEYVYGGYHAFDDLGRLSPQAREAAEATLRVELRCAVVELRDHLTAMLDD